MTDYPKDIKAFYMRMNDDGKTVAAADLLVPGVGEIIGGSQREERLDVLQKRIEELNMDLSDYGWYLELRKFGGVQHAGYGLGFERMVMYVTGMANIRMFYPSRAPLEALKCKKRGSRKTARKQDAFEHERSGESHFFAFCKKTIAPAAYPTAHKGHLMNAFKNRAAGSLRQSALQG